MKFAYKDTHKKEYNGGLTVLEYKKSPFQIDGAIAYLDGVFGPKINKTFTELFYIVDGEVDVEKDKKITTLTKDDIYIMQPGKSHKLMGKKAKIFIVCNPPFDPKGMEIIN